MNRRAFIKLLFCIFFAVGVNAQVTGVKFAPDHTRWTTETRYRTGTSSYSKTIENIYLNGDTIINTNYCQKIFKSTSPYFDTTCLQFYGYMYYNNNKLYTTDSTLYTDTASATLQCDFNLQVGDSFNLYVSCWCRRVGHNGYFKVPVDSVDPMYYGGK